MSLVEDESGWNTSGYLYGVDKELKCSQCSLYFSTDKGIVASFLLMLFVKQKNLFVRDQLLGEKAITTRSKQRNCVLCSQTHGAA